MVLDIIFCGIIILFSIQGLRTGLVRQTMAIGRIVLSIMGAVWLTPKIQPFLAKLVHNQHWCWAVTFVNIFLAIWILSLLLEAVILSYIQTSKMTPLDHCMGCVLGAICGAVVCVLLTMVLLSQPFYDPTPWIKDSHLGQFFAFYAQQLKAGKLPNTGKQFRHIFKTCLKKL